MVIIELTPDMITVPEDVGMVQLCLNVTQPSPDEDLPFEIFVDLATEVGSAGMKYINTSMHTLRNTCNSTVPK